MPPLGSMRALSAQALRARVQPPTRALTLLLHAARKGVDVRLLLSGPKAGCVPRVVEIQATPRDRRSRSSE